MKKAKQNTFKACEVSVSATGDAVHMIRVFELPPNEVFKSRVNFESRKLTYELKMLPGIINTIHCRCLKDFHSLVFEEPIGEVSNGSSVR